MDYSAIIEDTKKIVFANGFEDKITVIRSKVEELTLPVEKVLYILFLILGIGQRQIKCFNCVTKCVYFL